MSLAKNSRRSDVDKNEQEATFFFFYPGFFRRVRPLIISRGRELCTRTPFSFYLKQEDKKDSKKQEPNAKIGAREKGF